MVGSNLRLVCACLLLGLLFGCSSGARFQGLGAEGEFLSGKELYDNGRCFQAAEALQRFLSQHPGSALVDEAIFYLGLSRKCLGEYILAREEFDRLLREFPQSENREEAEWSRALCFQESRHSVDRDPEPTEQAIRAFEVYLDHYPRGAHREEAIRYARESTARLAAKAYENGKTYLMLHRYGAASIYFEKSLVVQPDSDIAPKVHLSLVRAYLADGKIETARAAFSVFQSFATPEHRERYGAGLEHALREAEEAIRSKAAELDGQERDEQASGEGP